MFSFFSRRPKSEPEKPPSQRATNVGATARGPAAADVEAERQRAAARRTAEQIDRIESEMIATEPGRLVTVATATGVRVDAALAVTMRRGTAAVRPAAPSATAPPPTALVQPARGAASPPVQGLVADRQPSPALAPLAFRAPFEPTIGHNDEGIHLGESVLPPDLEEAAILFANGQSEAAATTLEAAIVRDDLPDRGRQGWLMLLDVLQAADRRADFDARSIAYAARFETSPPAWREPVPAATVERRGLSTMVVSFGEAIDAGTARPAEQARKGAQQKRPLILDFSSVRRVEPDAGDQATRLVGSFIDSGRAITLRGARQLHEAARGAIAPGRRDASLGAWHLALMTLRLLGDQQAFEDLSIDYCVTYEVSPPSWEPIPPHVTVVLAGEQTGAAADPAAPRAGAIDADAAADVTADPGMSPTASEPGRVLELHGELSGRIATELGQLRAVAAGRRDVFIDARALMRLDFVAAGELLNEIAALCTAGKTVTIDEPSHVIEALLTVMGVREHARLRRRR